MDPPVSLATLFVLCITVTAATAVAQKLETSDYTFGPFNSSYYATFAVLPPATISNDALQVTPDSAGNFTLARRSGRVLFNRSFRLWEEEKGAVRVASFNTSFLVNVYRIDNTSVPGEGLAFLIAPDLNLPRNSHGQYLGLTNSTTDGDPSNSIVAIELDTFKQDFDPDGNHIGLDIHSVRSNKTVSLSDFGIEIAPAETKLYMVWVQYSGVNKELQVYMAERGRAKPTIPVLTADLDLKGLVNQNSYFGFAASTGTAIQLNCVLGWNLTVELLPSAIENGENNNDHKLLKIGIGVGVSGGLALLVIAVASFSCYIRKKRAACEPSLMGALKSLPGTPREFKYRDLKKATSNFDEKNKLGQGGFGVVYKGVLPKENIAVAVKKFSRDNLKSQDDFLAELTIINRLRHKHLVRLVGWCHKNEVLLLVYEYMPNGSLDSHIFHGPEEKTTLEWRLRYNIIAGVASALHYLHNEYDQKVVHRDLKASNIMLDSNFNARLGDFGLARALDNEKTSYAELEGVPGTMGYIAPECFHTGKATCESDVYGFGAVVLEVVCGLRPWTKVGGFQFLVDWVWWLHREGRILEAVDERLGNDYIVEEAQRLLLLGLACSHPIASERPKAQAIFQIISGLVAVPRIPPFKPAFVWPSTAGPDTSVSSINMDITADTTPMTSGWTPRCDSPQSYSGGQTDSSLL
ncbi:serine-threonine protein kinase, plant-type, putative [Ricinus communis]|uniref:Serine-threonine protein kinase, plant-type, putative n=1 Tax=Ricinus communis TaxID=3988 RepID=B9SRB8_RICCO|nr:serine-threonine protein kinase, plant-type, putative [Ricinus communis]|eukprot:XP_002528537.1 probable L-type lectin-domain containing receptor kinase S.5 [Ricinus communis]